MRKIRHYSNVAEMIKEKGNGFGVSGIEKPPKRLKPRSLKLRLVYDNYEKAGFSCFSYV